MRVREIMTPDPISAGPETPLQAVRRLLVDREIRHLPVIEGGRLVGIVSSKDVLNGAGTVGEVMSHEVRTIGGNETIQVAGAVMALHKVSCLPVVEDGQMVGIITTYDLLDALVKAERDVREAGNGDDGSGV
jgi:acetoin utilization protein AcuB